jgi:hypothetical protein
MLNMMNLILALILIYEPGTIMEPDRIEQLRPMADLNIDDVLLA